MRAHGDGEAEQDVFGVVQRARRLGSQQVLKQRWSVVQPGRAAPHEIDLLAFEHRHVSELRGVLVDPMLDDQEARRQDLQHHAERGHRARGAPHHQLARHTPDAEVYPGALDGRRQARERTWPQRERVLEQHRLDGPIGRQEGQRDRRWIAFLALQARPEGGVHEGLDRPRIGPGGRGGGPGVGQMTGEVLLDPSRVEASGRVQRSAHVTRVCLERHQNCFRQSAGGNE